METGAVTSVAALGGYRVKRRAFILILAAAALWPITTHAQVAAHVQRIGYLGFGAASASANRVAALWEGLRALGYGEGKNIEIKFRWAGTIQQLRGFAAELVAMDVDVIFATSSTEVDAARGATKTIPIVFATHADPVGLGHIESLARPGGNTTGLTVVQSDLTPKAVAVLKEVVPDAKRFGVLSSPTAPSHRPTVEAAQAAAEKLGIEVQLVSVQSVEDFAGAFAAMVRDHVSAVFVAASSLSRDQRTVLAELALKHRMPSMFGARENVDAGGLMSYSPNHADLTRRSATYIDKILKGTRPADLPVEQASSYQLVINLKTANALGLTIPPSVLARADEVIE